MSQMGSLILQGLHAGAGSYEQAAQRAMAIQEFARRLGERKAAGRANLDLFRRYNPEPARWLEEPTGAAPLALPNPAAPGINAQLPGARDAVGRIAGGIQDAAGMPDNPAGQADFGQTGVGRNLQRLLGTVPDQAPPTVQGPQPTRMVENPEYQRWSGEMSNFEAAPPETQQSVMHGFQDFHNDQVVQQEFERRVRMFGDAIRNDGHPQDAQRFLKDALTSGRWPDYATKPVGLIEPASVKLFRSLSRSGMSGSITERAMGDTPVTQDSLQMLLSPDPAQRAQGTASYMQRFGHPPPASIMYRAGKGTVDPAQREQQWVDLVEQAGGQDKFDPALFPVLHDRYIQGQKSGDALWLKALGGDNSRGLVAALKAEHQSAVRDLTEMRSVKHSARMMGDTLTPEDAKALEGAESAERDTLDALMRAQSGGKLGRKGTTPNGRAGPAAAPPPPAGAPAGSQPDSLNPDLMDAIDADPAFAGRTPEEKAAEYRRRLAQRSSP